MIGGCFRRQITSTTRPRWWWSDPNTASLKCTSSDVHISTLVRLAHNGAASPAGERPPTPPYEQGQRDGKRRLYFYYVDAVNGFLFLDDMKHRNFTSCFKDKAFLSFFYSRLRVARSTDPGYGVYGAAFPWVSPCGAELNWIRAEDTPIVFTELRPDKEDPTTEVSGWMHNRLESRH
jgi:hypothetical protein